MIGTAGSCYPCPQLLRAAGRDPRFALVASSSSSTLRRSAATCPVTADGWIARPHFASSLGEGRPGTHRVEARLSGSEFESLDQDLSIQGSFPRCDHDGRKRIAQNVD